MSEMPSPVQAVLENLADPAFFVKDGTLTWVNKAAGRLALEPGDAISALLPDLPMPEPGFHAAAAAAMRGRNWDVTVQAVDQEHLVILRRQMEEQDGSAMLMAALRGVQPVLEELVSVGARFYPALEEREDEELQEYASHLCRASFRLMRSVQIMNAYDRYHRENTPLYLEKTDLTTYFREKAQHMADVLLDVGIHLEYNGPDKVVFGTIDRQEVFRALLLLVSNAAKYTEKDVPIRIKVIPADTRLRIRVTSCGRPMDPDVLSTAFSRFREPAAPHSEEQGSGLGLSVAQEIARRHGGNVVLESHDDGTHVTMTLDVSRKACAVDTPKMDYSGGYDPALVELSCILPASTFDSRNVDL